MFDKKFETKISISMKINLKIKIEKSSIKIQKFGNQKSKLKLKKLTLTASETIRNSSKFVVFTSRIRFLKTFQVVQDLQTICRPRAPKLSCLHLSLCQQAGLPVWCSPWVSRPPPDRFSRWDVQQPQLEGTYRPHPAPPVRWRTQRSRRRGRHGRFWLKKKSKTRNHGWWLRDRHASSCVVLAPPESATEDKHTTNFHTTTPWWNDDWQIQMQYHHLEK